MWLSKGTCGPKAWHPAEPPKGGTPNGGLAGGSTPGMPHLAVGGFEVAGELGGVHDGGGLQVGAQCGAQCCEAGAVGGEGGGDFYKLVLGGGDQFGVVDVGCLGQTGAADHGVADEGYYGYAHP